MKVLARQVILMLISLTIHADDHLQGSTATPDGPSWHPTLVAHGYNSGFALAHDSYNSMSTRLPSATTGRFTRSPGSLRMDVCERVCSASRLCHLLRSFHAVHKLGPAIRPAAASV
jgi:hypothetical protein